jgi:hypothetical protein
MLEGISGSGSEATPMGRLLWKNSSWSKKFILHGRPRKRTPTPLGHVLYPEASFREKLLQERRRAERSNKPLVIMVVNVEAVRSLDKDQEITGSLSEWVNTSVRGTDICGLLKDGKVIGVILTEVEPQKIDDAKRVVAKKTKEKLAAILGDDIVNSLTISFQTYPDTEVS